ncbi:MAG: hypothetical protein II979_07070, partial [Clostridia bacterium]|nr:hypothetical protein [Clostridia bacterium]
NFLRVDSRDSEACCRIRAFCKIFPGPVPVLFYYKDTGSYEKTDIPAVYLNDFILQELKEIGGEENLVLR